MLNTAKEIELITDEMSKIITGVVERMATEDGAHTVTVRRVLDELGITNRVFYNRFHNIDEVLQIIYKKRRLLSQSPLWRTPRDSNP